MGRGTFIFAIFYVLFGIYFINHFINFFQLPSFLQFLDSWIIFVGGLLMLFGITLYFRLASQNIIIPIPYLLLGLYFLTYPFNFQWMPSFITKLNEYILLVGGILFFVEIFLVSRASSVAMSNI
jgi:hypothetical protein